MVHHSCFSMAIALGRSKHFNHLFRPLKHDESRSTGSSWQFPHRKLLGSQNLIVSFCFGGETFEISMSMPMIPNGSNYIEVILMTRWWFQILYHFYPLFGEMIQFDLRICFRGEVGSTTNQMTVFNISLVCTQLYVGPPCSLASRGPHSPFERQTKLPPSGLVCAKICNPCTPFFPHQKVH